MANRNVTENSTTSFEHMHAEKWMYKTAVYTRVNSDMHKATHLKQQKSRTVSDIKQHLANVNVSDGQTEGQNW